MNKPWRVIGWTVLVLLGIGIVLGGAGWLTGASVNRIAELGYGGRDAAVAAGEAALARLTDLWQYLMAQVAGLF